MSKNETHDSVNYPKHYTSHPSGIECIQITEHMGFNLGNAVKYVWRADLKHDAVEDLRKAVWYIEREIAKRTNAPAVAVTEEFHEVDGFLAAAAAANWRVGEQPPLPWSVCEIPPPTHRACPGVRPALDGAAYGLCRIVGRDACEWRASTLNGLTVTLAWRTREEAKRYLASISSN